MEGLPEGVDSKFRYVLLVSKRAEQIIQGSAPKMRTKHAKPTRQAMEEIDKAQVTKLASMPTREQMAKSRWVPARALERSPDNLQLRLGLEQPDQAVAKDGMIVGHDDTNGHA